MSRKKAEKTPENFYAQSYESAVPDWPGEIDYYQKYAAAVKAEGGWALEIACGTGRVAIRLAEAGVNLVGLDLSASMLAVAKQKSQELDNLRWVEGDMRSFQIDQTFLLTLIPGHAFQNLTSSEDQAACLECIKRHLSPGGKLIVHLDHMNLANMSWLGGLCKGESAVFKPAEEFQHPQTGNQVRTLLAWTYLPATQTAVLETVWEELDDSGGVLNRIEREPIFLHCVFRFEMNHLLSRAGFEVESVYGDFFQQLLGDESPSMIWVAKRT